MRLSAKIAAGVAVALALAASDAVAKSTYGDPSADVRVDHGFIDVGDRASTYQFSSVENFQGLTWIGGGKRPSDLRAILNMETRNSRLDTDAEVAALFEAARSSTGSFAYLGDTGGALTFALTNTRGTVDHFGVGGVSTVPIPGAAWLLASGVAGLAWARRRRS